ncbi:oxidoreductase [Sphingomonas bacterium]|uniref:oxidoreductase n=1 Tax=Sphingomonas bacterium TaxID=1895847 RepID=UPI001576315A|nr:oxidoreductase [Sphingomonas bacterium]
MSDSVWTPAAIPSLIGRRAIVTGANSGIGWHTALELARAGAEVVLPARSATKGDEAAARIRRDVPDARLVTGLLDLADLASVRAFAAQLVAEDRPLDLLINNAGVMALPTRTLGPDGYEMQFATNVVGPYVLTGLLMPLLLRAAAPRVVNVSSSAHAGGGPVPLRDLNCANGYKPMQAYARTKLANLLFTRELQRRYAGRLLVAASHPGIASTNLAAGTTVAMKVAVTLLKPLIQSASAGAEPSLMAATAPDIEPGGYYGPAGLLGMRGHPARVVASPLADDVAAARALFDELERLTGVRYPAA